MKYALFISKDYENQFTTGKVYKIRKDDGGNLIYNKEWVSIEEDDSGYPNGWCRQYFILIPKMNKLIRLFYS